jgi:RIO-like serine/threonine protein kinase
VLRATPLLLLLLLLLLGQALGDHGFPVPVAIDNNRHAVLMELVDGQPLVQV